MKTIYILALCLFLNAPAWSADADTPATMPATAPIKIGIVDLSNLDTTNADVMAAAKVLLEKAAQEQGIALVCDQAALLFVAPTLQKVDLNASIKALVAANPRGAITPPANSVTKPKEAIATALKELRRMASVVKAGVSYQSYGERLADLKANVDEALIDVPDGDLKNTIKDALQTYQDAAQWWDLSFKAVYISVLFKVEPSKELMAKYHIMLVPPKGFAKYGKIYQDGVSKLLYVSQPLSTIWNAAEVKIKTAEDLSR